MLLRSPSPSLLLRPFLLVAFVALPLSPALAAEGEQLDYDRHDETRIVHFEIRPGEIELPAPLSVSIWGDGRVEVSRPSWQRQAGRYEINLSQAELQTLLLELTSQALVEFEPARVKEEKRKALAARWEAARAEGKWPALSAHSSGDVTFLSLQLTKYFDAASGGPPQPVKLAVEWHGLRHDVKEFSTNDSLAALSQAHAVLRDLLARTELGG